MAKVMAILPDQAVAEVVTNQLSALNNESIDWRLTEPGDDNERVMPLVGWPLGSGSGTTGGGAPIGLAVPVNVPDDQTIKDQGASDDDAAYYGRSVAHGGIAIVVETPDDAVGQVRRILDQAGAQQVTAQ